MRRLAKALLQRSGRRSVDVVEALERLHGAARMARDLRRRALHPRLGPRLWSVDPENLRDAAEPLAVSRNCLDDVFKYDDPDSAITRGAFIGMVMRRLEHGCQLFTYAPGDKLLIRCWACSGGGRAAYESSLRKVPGDGTVLFDFHVHRECTSLDVVQRFMERTVAAMAPAQGGARLYYAGALDAALQQVMRRCGFVAQERQPGRMR